MAKSKIYKLYKQMCYDRVSERGGRCQVCNEHVNISGDWHYDRWNFDHIISHNHDTDEQFINGFLFIHKELHIYKNTMASNLKEHFCVKYFLESYFYSNKCRLFYKRFLELNPIASKKGIMRCLVEELNEC